MKKTLILCAALLALPLTAVAGSGEWFDMANCQICSHMAEAPGFMENVEWENHELSNGWMMVTKVQEGFKDNWAGIQKNMEAEGAKIAGGAEAHLCNFCQNYMALMGTGAIEMQQFQTIGGEITLLTSKDEAVVADLKKHAKRTIHEMEKMMGGGGHGE